MDNQPTQPTPPLLSSSNPSKTLLLVAGAIALTAISAAGGYYLGANKQYQPSQPPSQPSQSFPTPTATPSPISDETVNWKTYTNTKVGYSFKYPSQLLPYISESQTGTGVSLSNVTLPIPLGSSPWDIYIGARESKEKLDVKSYVDKQIRDLQISSNVDLTKSIERKQTIVGGIVGESVVGLPAANIRKTVFVIHNNWIYSFTIDPYATGDTYDKLRQQVFNQILSTFKFTQ